MAQDTSSEEDGGENSHQGHRPFYVPIFADAQREDERSFNASKYTCKRDSYSAHLHYGPFLAFR